MGCGAGAHAPPPSKEVEESQQAPDSPAGTPTAWAESTKSLSNVSDSAIAASKGDPNVMLLDADDPDEVEFIYEAPAKQQVHRSFQPIQPFAANAQEPPDAAELDVRQPEPQPLSKQQQDEAAKLAQKRKAFDNQRYQRDPRSADPMPGDSAAHISVLRQGGSARSVEQQPGTDMMLGLNADARHRDVASKEALIHASCLPGGIFDDEDDLRPPPQNISSGYGHHALPARSQQQPTQKHHQDFINSSKFDADDEKLMSEILENFNS